MAGKNTTPARKKAFLEAYSQCASIFHSCQAVGIARQTYYGWRKKDPKFAKACDESITINTERLEYAAYKRAIGGESKGADTLLIFLLKSRKPDVYSDRFKHEHSGEGGSFRDFLLYWQERENTNANPIPGEDS